MKPEEIEKRKEISRVKYKQTKEKMSKRLKEEDEFLKIYRDTKNVRYVYIDGKYANGVSFAVKRCDDSSSIVSVAFLSKKDKPNNRIGKIICAKRMADSEGYSFVHEHNISWGNLIDAAQAYIEYLVYAGLLYRCPQRIR